MQWPEPLKSALSHYLKGAAPAGIAEEMHYDMAEPRHFVGHSGLLVLAVRRLEGPVIEQRPAHDVGARNEAPVAGIEAVVAMIAHHEELAGRDDQLAIDHVVGKIDGPGLGGAGLGGRGDGRELIEE